MLYDGHGERWQRCGGPEHFYELGGGAVGDEGESYGGDGEADGGEMVLKGGCSGVFRGGAHGQRGGFGYGVQG